MSTDKLKGSVICLMICLGRRSPATSLAKYSHITLLQTLLHSYQQYCAFAIFVFLSSWCITTKTCRWRLIYSSDSSWWNHRRSVPENFGLSSNVSETQVRTHCVGIYEATDLRNIDECALSRPYSNNPSLGAQPALQWPPDWPDFPRICLIDRCPEYVLSFVIDFYFIYSFFGIFRFLFISLFFIRVSFISFVLYV